jgi:hypothetical protein
MVDAQMLEDKRVQLLLSLLKNERVSKVSIFGSYSHHKMDANDIDVLVDFARARTFPDLVRIERELSEAVGCKVDLVTRDALSPYLAERINRDARVIYEG